jgi:alkylhydroperoxidase family enzyme
VLEDYRSADIEPKLRAMLEFLDKLTLEPDSIGPDDADTLREAGLSEAAIEDAIVVCSAFHMITRLADAFAFALPENGWDAAVRNLLKRGYA